MGRTPEELLEGLPVVADSAAEVAADHNGLGKLTTDRIVAEVVLVGSTEAVEVDSHRQLGAAGTGKGWRLEEQCC